MCRDEDNWVKHSYTNLCRNYDHINNYKNLVNKILNNEDILTSRGKIVNNIKLYDSLLVLNSLNGELIIPKYKTFDEKKEAFISKIRSYNKYYLYCSQCSNFQTRSLLIPVDLIPEKTKQIWQDIKKLSNNNIVICNIVFDERVGTPDEKSKELMKLCSIFDCASENYHYDDRYYGEHDDIKWQKYSYNDLCCGFNNIKNYDNLLKLKEHDEHEIIVVDSILKLESRNGKIQQNMYDTVDEMLYDLYLKDIIN